MNKNINSPVKLLLMALSFGFLLSACNASNTQEGESNVLSDNASTNSGLVVSSDFSDSIDTSDNLAWEYAVKDYDDYSLKNISFKGFIPVSYTNSLGNDMKAEAFISVGNGVGGVYVGITITDISDYESVFDYHSDSCTFTINMTDTSGKQNVLKGSANSNSPNILINKTEDVRKIIDALNQDGTLSFEIVDDDFPDSKYYFSVDTLNFAEEYRESGFSVKSNSLYG